MEQIETPGPASPGKLRSIFRDHRPASWILLAAVGLLGGALVATTLWATDLRFKREVTRIAYAHDARGLRFLAARESGGLERQSRAVAHLEEQAADALAGDAPYLVVSIEERRVWYLQGDDTLFSAPVAVGTGATMVIGGTTKRFHTPRGRMTITAKELDPVWVPPDWHYIEIARKQGLRVVDMSDAPPGALSGFPAGEEPISGGTIYIPPHGSPQRQHRGVLGVAKLEMQDGYYFHGTNNEASVGTAASHGCIRMLKEDVLWMYRNVPVGTEVYIY